MATLIRLPPGHVVATSGALDALAATSTHTLSLLSRHATGDWGDFCPEDMEANHLALPKGARTLSADTRPGGVLLRVATEADRSVTTILRREDY
jgi:hypothetical protein